MTKYKGYTFEYHYKFKKEFNKILTKHNCPTLKSDFKLLYDVLIQHLSESDKFPPHICMNISGLESYVTIPSFIIKKFRCEGINRGVNSSFRITFLFDKDEERFILVEIFNKNKKSIPNKKRINELFVNEIDIYDELYSGEEEYLNDA